MGRSSSRAPKVLERGQPGARRGGCGIGGGRARVTTPGAGSFPEGDEAASYGEESGYERRGLPGPHDDQQSNISIDPQGTHDQQSNISSR